MLPEQVITLIGPATLLAQLSVSVIRQAFRGPSGDVALAPWVSPALAVGLGIVFSFLLLLIGGIGLTPANLATAVVAGFISGASAVGITEQTRRAT